MKKRGAAKKSTEAGRLLRVLALWKQVEKESLLVAAHVARDLYFLGYIPFSYFGYSKQWHRTNDYEFISLINSKFPLLHQRSWQGLLLYFALITNVIYDLGTKAYPMG